MPKQTTFLSLILPEKNEFVNSWNEPVNQNSEDIDNWVEDLYNSLVGTSGTSTWGALRGSRDSLAIRLDEALDAFGNIKVSNAPDILDMATSEVRGPFSAPRDRLNDGDHLVFDAGQPVADGRFSPMPSGGPSAGFPGETLDSGIAIRSSDFGAENLDGFHLGSPMKPSAPGLVTGGAANLISGIALSQVRFAADITPAIFNIDGYVFRIREQIDLDYSLLSPGVGDYVWLFVARNEAGSEPYGHSLFKYNQDGGFAIKDLRVRQAGGDGITATSVFTSSSAKFTTATLGKVKAGDLLVITGGGDAEGSYVIDAIDGTDTDTKLTIKGVFHANLSSLPWHIQDNAMPNIGAVVTGTDSTVEPPFVAGRVYIGRVLQTGGAPDPAVTFAKCGVYASPWTTVTPGVLEGTPADFVHDLGVVPSSVEIQVRAGSTDPTYQPLVERTVVTEVANLTHISGVDDTASLVTATLLFPSVRWHSTNTVLTVRLKNTSTDPNKPAALFTDSAGVDHTAAGEMRVVARR